MDSVKGAFVGVQRRHVPPQACHSRCSVIHPAGDITIEAIFFKISNLLVEWSGQLIFLGSTMVLLWVNPETKKHTV
ncbi:MAG: hypothetical protein P8163_10475 [Candidatus Thiodiazotropha sp.]